MRNSRKSRKRGGVVRLPIVDVDYALSVLRDQVKRKSLIGMWRQVVEKVAQILANAKRNQIDGIVELDCNDVGSILQALGCAVELTNFIDFFNRPDDE